MSYFFKRSWKPRALHENLFSFIDWQPMIFFLSAVTVKKNIILSIRLKWFVGHPLLISRVLLPEKDTPFLIDNLNWTSHPFTREEPSK